MSEVPGWLYRCDVLVELLREERPYDDVVSPRVYEYLATGKPIVSMLWPGQVERFPDVIYNARDEGEFLTLCAHALEEDPGFVAGRGGTTPPRPPGPCGRPRSAASSPPPACSETGATVSLPLARPLLFNPTKIRSPLANPPFSDKMEPY